MENITSENREIGKARKSKSPGFSGIRGPRRETQRGETEFRKAKTRLVTDSLQHPAKGKESPSGNDEKPF